MVRNGTLVDAPISRRCRARCTACTTRSRARMKVRPPASSTWRHAGSVSDALTFFGQVGTSKGDGKTPTQDVSETNPGNGAGAGYALHGIGIGARLQPRHDEQHDAVPQRRAGHVRLDLRRAERRREGQGELGARSTASTRSTTARGRTEVRRALPEPRALRPAMRLRRVRLAARLRARRTIRPRFRNYPSNFNTFGGAFPTGVWYWTPAQLAAYNGPAIREPRSAGPRVLSIRCST